MLELDSSYCEGTKEEVIEYEGMEREEWIYERNDLSWVLEDKPLFLWQFRGNYTRPGHEGIK